MLRNRLIFSLREKMQTKPGRGGLTTSGRWLRHKMAAKPLCADGLRCGAKQGAKHLCQVFI